MYNPRLELHEPDKDKSFIVKDVQIKEFTVKLHYHAEIELMLILDGEGRRNVGDSNEAFGPGDLVLVGPNLSHVWENNRRHKDSGRQAKAQVILFKEDCFGERFFKTPEMKLIQELFERAQQGIRFKGKTADLVSNKIGITKWHK